MKTRDLDYNLPEGLIAQRPLRERESSRLLVLNRTTKKWEDREFREFPELLRGDELLVVNNARVIPARLFGFRRGLHSQPPGRRNPSRHEFLTTRIEILLTRQLSTDVWEALVRPGRKMPTGEHIVIAEGELEAEVTGRGEYGVRQLRFSSSGRIEDAIERLGHVPLPPYIDRQDDAADRERYQTIFATQPGAVAAPTAGLHFSAPILERLKAQGTEIVELTLRVGLGTFQPIHAENLEEHRMHIEEYEIPESTAAKINAAVSKGRPVLAVGTTVVRALEDASQKSVSRHNSVPIEPGPASADLFISPGYEFRIVRQLLTNFHLPKSSLLAMVCAFAGQEFLLGAYHHAVAREYRFYSYGDCMLIR